MSAAVKAAMLATKDLKPNERLVLIAIAAHTNRDSGEAWPSVATISEYAGVSVRTVHRVLAKLVQLGRLVVRKVVGIASNVYRLILDAVTPAATSAISAGDTAKPAVESANDSGKLADEALEDQSKLKRPAGRDWRRFMKPKTATPQRQPYGYPERRGAALPADRTDQCPSHRGSPAGNCGPCRSEALGGVA
jgi:DNA-binding transcriptional regulator YhcF (GntR family)